MGIWSRLGDVISSYISGMGESSGSGASRSSRRSSDPDLDAAWDELDDFLNQKDKRGGYSGEEQNASYAKTMPPEELRPDFEYLGVPFGADAAECKAAYKRLLKIHHPDRHAGHEGNYKKATERSAKINAAWERIEKWRKEA